MFNYNLFAGITEFSAYHGIHLRDGFIKTAADNHSLSGRKSVGLDYIRGIKCFKEISCITGIGPVESSVSSRRNKVPDKKGFGKILASLKTGRRFHRTDHRDINK